MPISRVLLYLIELLQRKVILFLDLQVASDAKGRGVLRLLLLQQRFNLLSIVGLCQQLISILFQSVKSSPRLCFSFEIVTFAVSAHRIVSSIAITLGR